MKNITRHNGKLEIITRLASSLYGNPRYLLSIDGVQCRTGVDSSHGYSVTNYENKEVNATIGTHYGYATLNTLSTNE
jgi:hypothetical protein